MVFSSITFLFLYLPLVLAAYFLLPKRTRNFFLLLVSLLFYFWGENWLVLIMLLTTVIDYISGLFISGAIWDKPGTPIKWLEPGGHRTGWQKLGLVLSICANLSILGFFKYFNFGMDNYNAVVGFLGLSSLQWKDVFLVTLPLGVSFYTFQSMSYTIDVYLGHTKATRHPIDFACFVTLFPQLVAGPIVRYHDIAEQLVTRTVTRDGFAYGVKRFIVGLGKKILIANTVALPADLIFSLPNNELTPGLVWLAVVCYTLQIYFDFSGYSDMAIGLGWMFGFEFIENFLHPYTSQSIKEFWRRWHVSLSTWFRDYLYIPLGGNKTSVTRMYFNLCLVFLLCGLWHGAQWNFVVWGLFHGAFLVIERLGLEKTVLSFWRPFRHVYVMLITMVSWILFRADTLSEAGVMLSSMVGFAPGDGVVQKVGLYLNAKVMLAIVLGAIGSAPVGIMLGRYCENLLTRSSPQAQRYLEPIIRFGEVFLLIGILLASVVFLAAGTHNPFIYFRF